MESADEISIYKRRVNMRIESAYWFIVGNYFLRIYWLSNSAIFVKQFIFFVVKFKE